MSGNSNGGGEIFSSRWGLILTTIGAAVVPVTSGASPAKRRPTAAGRS